MAAPIFAWIAKSLVAEYLVVRFSMLAWAASYDCFEALTLLAILFKRIQGYWFLH